MRIILFLFLYSSFLLAAQWASVKSEKAIIYADTEMSAAIGYLSNGKKIRVGEVARNKGSLVPIIINKKIAYIKLSDLKLSKDEKLVTSAVERRKLADEKKTISRLGLSLARYHSQAQASELKDGDDFSFNSGALTGCVNKIGSRSTYAAQIEYLSATNNDSDSKFNFYSINMEYLYRLIDFENMSFMLSIGGSIIPLSQFTYQDLFTVNSTGYGLITGAEFFMGLKESLGLHIAGKYRFIQTLGYDIPESDQVPGFSSNFTPNFGGFSLQAAVTYAF